MAESKLCSLSMEFSVRLLKTTEGVKGHYSIINQLERAATSIGANIYEATYAQSTPDFISKLQIALKESHETEYWLELLEKTEILSSDVIVPLKNSCGTIRRLLIASVNTAKNNLKKGKPTC